MQTYSLMGFRRRRHCGFSAIVVILLSVLLASSTLAANQPCEQIRSDLVQQVASLKATLEQLQQLKTGRISPQLALDELIAVDDMNPVAAAQKNRTLEDSLNRKNGVASCDSPAYKKIHKEYQKTIGGTHGVIVNFLNLPGIQKKHLQSLIEINQQRARQYSEQQQSEQQHSSAQHQLLQQFSQALIKDYYATYLDSKKSHRELLSSKIFNALADDVRLASLEWQGISSNTPKPRTYNQQLSALIIIYQHLFRASREYIPFLQQLSNAKQQLALESNILFRVPLAKTQLYATGNALDYGYLATSLLTSKTSLFIQAILLILFSLLLRKAPHWLADWEHNQIRNRFSKSYSPYWLRATRIVRPNLGWMIAFLLSLLIYLLPASVQPYMQLFNALMLLLGSYYLIQCAAFWALNNTYRETHLFVAKDKQQQLVKSSQRLAAMAVISILIYLFIRHFIGDALLDKVALIVAIATIYVQIYRITRQLDREFLAHLSRRTSKKNISRVKAIQQNISGFFVMPLLFICVQFYDALLALHNRLLNIELYQTLAAKFLKIRLEQQSDAAKDSNDDQNLQDNDHEYDDWFCQNENEQLDENLLIERKYSDSINQSISAWLDGKKDENDIILIGEPGIGKTTLIKQWQSQWDKTTCVYLSINEKIICPDSIFKKILSLLDMDERISEEGNNLTTFAERQKQRPKTVIILDNIENLFLCDVGGFEAYKKLQSLISAKLENIFWLAAVNQQSWTFLDDIFGNNYQFSQQIRVARWSQQEIRNLILKRHQASKRRLEYDEILLASTAHNETATRAAESRCFNLLWDQAAGIPAIAMAIWRSSTQKLSSRRVEMQVPERPVFSSQQELSDDFLFVMAAIMRHHNINTQQTEKVTHLPEAITRRALKQSQDLGLLLCKSHGRYEINALWYIQVYQLLKRKNFVYE